MAFSPKDSLTPTEAAVASGVSLRDANRVIDERILPENYYSTRETRGFKPKACVFISFYFQAADRLTSAERQRAIALAAKASFDWKRSKGLLKDGFLTIDFTPFAKDVDERLRRLQAAREMVSCDEEILGGLPVIKGTRVPVYDVAASASAGIPMQRLLSSYPSVTQEQIELSTLFATANPLRGRPVRVPLRERVPAVLLSSRRVPIHGGMPK